MRPGLSGVGSIVFRAEERLLSAKADPIKYYETEIAPYKAALESWCVEKCSLRLYLKCIFLTVWVVLFPNSKLATVALKGIPMPEGQLRSDFETII